MVLKQLRRLARSGPSGRRGPQLDTRCCLVDPNHLAVGIHDLQNGYVERLIGTIHRECLDQVIIFSERHLRRVLVEYSDYYNTMRTHRSLRPDQ